MQLPEITLIFFYVFNVLRIAAYLPQILRVAADRDGARAISYTTWFVWIGANGSTAAYALVIAPSLALFVVSMLNAIGCAAVVVLTAWKRHQLGAA
ncbi:MULTISPECIES: hypothetical protein [unclassified Bradyrhizobium]|uniref:hypothetical protein n=1 Tax=unclassified Bradyrhizobium TaxID=2631580 RepID=UPI0023038E3B|nr:hypothetical protein [Bradyrhizobium sp. CCBAU 45321]MDA9546149.1 hypothetical protein [Bradyrhizobium sp. CCBAU 45321]